MRVLILIILFLFLFGSRTHFGLDVSVILNGLIFLFLSVKLRIRKIKLHKLFTILFIGLMLDFALSFIWPIYHNTYDFSMLKSKANFIVSITNIYFVCRYFILDKNICPKTIFKLLMFCLVIQSVIIILSLLNPEVGNIINSLSKDESMITRMQDSYGGARGYGLASSSAFGLSITFAALVLCLFYAKVKEYMSGTLFVSILVLSVIPAMSAGRSAIIAYLLGFVFLLLTQSARRVFALSMFMFVSVISLSFLLNYHFGSLLDGDNIEVLYDYAMEPIIQYKKTGSFSTTSTDGLQNMYFKLTDKQMLVGDGYYTDPITLRYYKHTDAGYMRFALFYGVGLSAILYGLYLFFLYRLYLLLPYREERCFIVMMCIMSFILHYKGEVVLFALGYNKVVFIALFTLYLYYSKIKYNVCKDD